MKTPHVIVIYMATLLSREKRKCNEASSRDTVLALFAVHFVSGTVISGYTSFPVQ
jgi:hypothetical protein